MRLKLLTLLFFPSALFAGTITTYFNPLGTVTFSSATASADTIVFDAKASTFPASGNSPISISLTIGSCADRALFVGCDNSNSDSISGITVGGNALTLSTSSIISIYGTSIWYYVNPPSGVQTIAITTASGITGRTGCSISSWCGVAQNSPVEASTATFNYPAGGFSTATLTTTQFGDLILDAVVDDNAQTIVTTQPGQAALVNTIRTNDTMAFSSRTVTTAGTYTMGWSGISTPFSQTAIAVKPGP